MARTLLIELPDELEQQVMAQAVQQQVSPENIVLQALSQTLTKSQAHEQSDDPPLDFEDLNLPPELKTAFQNVESPDPQERVQALLTLRKLYCEPK